jgi:hypothetical protein
MKLSYIKSVGRYENTKTGKLVNVKKGRNMQRGTDLLFYLYRGKRQFISDLEFSKDWKLNEKEI